MITKGRGDNHRYELEYPRYSLLHARIEFINAVSKCAPEVFECLHGKPLEAYQASKLLDLRGGRRMTFWRDCICDTDLYTKAASDGYSIARRFEMTIPRRAAAFFPDWGLDITKDTHIAHFNLHIRPALEAWLRAMEEWALNFNLQAGWMFE